MRYRIAADETAAVSVKDTGDGGVAIVVSMGGAGGVTQTIAVLEGGGTLRLLSLHGTAARTLGLEMDADGRIAVR